MAIRAALSREFDAARAEDHFQVGATAWARRHYVKSEFKVSPAAAAGETVSFGDRGMKP
jgi:hypothetical protein